MKISKYNFLIVLSIPVFLNSCSTSSGYCENPTALTGNTELLFETDNSSLDYIVEFYEDVDFAVELERMIETYDIKNARASAMFNRFAAFLSRRTMEQIRCEKSVQTVFIIDTSVPVLVPSPPPAPPPPPPPESGGGGSGGGM